MQRIFQWPEMRRILPDVLAFALGLGVARLWRWQTADLVWSLWLSSLVLGYLTILSTIGGLAYAGLTAIAGGELRPEQRWKALLLGSAGALFFLGFFSLHFCGFHAGHAGFLSVFFPLQGLPPRASISIAVRQRRSAGLSAEPVALHPLQHALQP